jgi:hypothetical protein
LLWHGGWISLLFPLCQEIVADGTEALLGVPKLSGLEKSRLTFAVVIPLAHEKVEPPTTLLILFVGSTATTLLAGVNIPLTSVLLALNRDAELEKLNVVPVWNTKFTRFWEDIKVLN